MGGPRREEGQNSPSGASSDESKGVGTRGLGKDEGLVEQTGEGEGRRSQELKERLMYSSVGGQRYPFFVLHLVRVKKTRPAFPGRKGTLRTKPLNVHREVSIIYLSFGHPPHCNTSATPHLIIQHPPKRPSGWLARCEMSLGIRTSTC